ncbi:MAG: hypothetical protein JSV26_02375 [bacterium]|nr:MAG: hypothetical protein JSV26_02375 [bacterium]
MFDDFNFKVLEFERELSLEEIEGKMKTMADAPGSFTPLGDRGLRWTPDSWELPTIYFADDGKTLEVVTKDLDIGDVDDFLCQLAQVLECKILGEHLEYY